MIYQFRIILISRLINDYTIRIRYNCTWIIRHPATTPIEYTEIIYTYLTI
jgi:hypothetical protein